jgi:hypothetical protein
MSDKKGILRIVGAPMVANWRITLNHQHFAIWIRIGIWWATMIVLALIFGPHARTDELLFAVFVVPATVLLPYALGTLIIAWAKTMLLPRLSGRP